MSYLRPNRSGLRIYQIILLLGFGAAFGLAATYFLLSPRVSAVSPEAGARTGAYAAIEIRFSTPMGAECTADHFSAEPPADGALAIQGDTLRFTPKDAWPAVTTVQVSIRSGACSRNGLPLLAGRSWSFSPSLVRIAYLPLAEPNDRIMSITIDGGDPVVLATAPSAIQNFAISPRGDFAVLATGASNRPGMLWTTPLDGQPATLLLDCGGDACGDPTISPDGTQVAYVRTRLKTDSVAGAIPFEPFIERLAIDGRQIQTVSPAGTIADKPSWSRQGWLSYFDASRQVIVIDDLAGGQTVIPNISGSTWTWMPDGTSVIFTEIIEGAASDSTDTVPRLYSHLLQVNVQTNQRFDLSGADLLEDATPAVSPDGLQLAFSRNFFDTRWTPGRQLWLMNLEDLRPRPLTQTAEYSHSSIQWSRDGSRLVFMRFHETVPDDPPEIWCMRADGSDPRRLVVGGFLPKWLP